jgi:hypothetical protein
MKCMHWKDFYTRGDTFSVKFGIYVDQMTIFKHGIK